MEGHRGPTENPRHRCLGSAGRPYRPLGSVQEVALDAEHPRYGILIRDRVVGAGRFRTLLRCYVSNTPIECRVEMPPHNVEADVEVRNRVPQGSASHAGHAEIGIAANASYRYPVGDGAQGQVRTDRRLRSPIILYAKHAAIDRRSPLRIPSM